MPVLAVRRNGLLTDLKVFLDDVRLHDWAPGLPANATYYRGEIPRAHKALPRFVDEFVMGQLQGDEALDRPPDLTTRTAVVIMIETGLRSVDCPRLPLDPITTDEAGAPYPALLQSQASKDAVIPISDRVLAQIRRQQDGLRDRYATAPRFLLPAIRKNPNGQRALSWSTLNRWPGGLPTAMSATRRAGRSRSWAAAPRSPRRAPPRSSSGC
jgi:integrase